MQHYIIFKYVKSTQVMTKKQQLKFVSTCTPRQLSVTMALYLRSLGIEDGAEQARARKEVNPLLRSD